MKRKNVAKTACVIFAVLLLAACESPSQRVLPQPEQTSAQSAAEPASSELTQNQDEAKTAPTAAPTAKPTPTVQPMSTREQALAKLEVPEPLFPEHLQKYYTVIAKSGLVVRNKPYIDGDKIETLQNGTLVKVLCGMSYGVESWVYISYDGNYGWVCSNYLRSEQRPKPNNVYMTKKEAQTFFNSYFGEDLEWIDTFSGIEVLLTQHPELITFDYSEDTCFFGVPELMETYGMEMVSDDNNTWVVNKAGFQKLLDSVYGKNRMYAEDWGEVQDDNIVLVGWDGWGGLFPTYYAKQVGGVSVDGALATIQLRVMWDEMNLYDYAEEMAQRETRPMVSDEQRMPDEAPQSTDDADEYPTFDTRCRDAGLNPEDFGIIDVVLFKDETGVHLWGAFPEEQVNYPW